MTTQMNAGFSYQNKEIELISDNDENIDENKLNELDAEVECLNNEQGENVIGNESAKCEVDAKEEMNNEVKEENDIKNINEEEIENYQQQMNQEIETKVLQFQEQISELEEEIKSTIMNI
jgi:hypothetical protein